MGKTTRYDRAQEKEIQIDELWVEHLLDKTEWAVFSCGGIGPWKPHFEIGKTPCGCGTGAVLEAKVVGKRNAEMRGVGSFIAGL